MSDKNVVYGQIEEAVEQCPSGHVCRRCRTTWSRNEVSGVMTEISPRRQPLKQRIISSFRRYRWYYLIATVVVIIVIVVSVVVKVVVFHAETPAGLYRGGAGLVALDRGDESTMVDVFYQHSSGQIRHTVFNSTSKQWGSGQSDENVLSQFAVPPRQGTPLMAVTTMIGNATTYRVLYIDVNSTLQESIASAYSSKFPTTWLPGPLGLSQYKAHASPSTGISVCKHMLWDPDALGLNNGALVLLYGGSDGMNHMLTHNVQDTAWTPKHTFENSSAESGIECTVRGSNILDTWMINSKGQLTQASFNFDNRSSDRIYPPLLWTTGVVYNLPVQVPTPISVIKYTGDSSVFQSNSTFVHFVSPGGIVTGINVDTYNRSHSPVATDISWSVSDAAIDKPSKVANGSKIASVALRTNIRNQNTQEFGQERKIFLQLEANPAQISVMSANFYNNGFSADKASSIQQ